MKHLWKPALSVYTEMLAMLEANYPEALKNCFIVNGDLNAANYSHYALLNNSFIKKIDTRYERAHCVSLMCFCQFHYALLNNSLIKNE